MMIKEESRKLPKTFTIECDLKKEIMWFSNKLHEKCILNYIMGEEELIANIIGKNLLTDELLYEIYKCENMTDLMRIEEINNGLCKWDNFIDILHDLKFKIMPGCKYSGNLKYPDIYYIRYKMDNFKDVECYEREEIKENKEIIENYKKPYI